MIVAHVAGLPVEELLVPLLSTGGALTAAFHLALACWRGHDR